MVHDRIQDILNRRPEGNLSLTTRMKAGYLRKNGVPDSESATLLSTSTRSPSRTTTHWSLSFGLLRTQST